MTDEHRGLNIDTPYQYTGTPGTSSEGEGVFALVDAQGYQLMKLASGTVEIQGADIGISGGTLNALYAGTVTSIPAITGSVFGTVGGTVQSVGTGQVVGTVQAIGSTTFATGTVTSIAGGTVQTQGTSQVIGSVQSVGTAQVVGTLDTQITGEIADDTFRYPRIDASSHAFKTIEYEHAEIHSCSSFVCHYEQDCSGTAHRTIIAFKTPNNAKWIHIVPSASSSDATEAYVYEGPTVVDNVGGTLDIFNRNRNGTKTSGVIDTSTNPDAVGKATYFDLNTGTAVSGGTVISHRRIGDDKGPKSLGGEARAQGEWILKQNTQYAFVTQSANTNDNHHSIELDWYEHTDKD